LNDFGKLGKQPFAPGEKGLRIRKKSTAAIVRRLDRPNGVSGRGQRDTVSRQKEAKMRPVRFCVLVT